MNPRLVTIFRYLFFLALGAFFAWLSVRNIDSERWDHIRTSLGQARKWLFVPVLFLLLLSHYSRSIRWKILMEPLGYSPSNFNVFAAVMVGYLVNAGVPRLGEVVKCTMLARYEKVRADRLVGTIVVERAVDVLCLLVVFFLSLVLEGDVIGDYMRQKLLLFFHDKSGNLSAGKLLAAAAGGAALVGLLIVVLKRFGHIDFIARIKKILLGIWHGLNSIRFIRRKREFLFHTLLIWTLYLLSTTIGIYALKETAHLGLGGGLTTLAVGSVGMILTPGGIGAYPLLVAELMGLYGLDSSTVGTALGWLLWSSQTFIVLVTGLACLALVSRHNRNRALAAKHPAG
ncbi:MAG TPA: lysylphosphatidylglycerol synthase transmembrane domain-containing protein [Chitinophagaceae bacterium]|nr:lysylphosphatidylglycerol synthase transmembrane domain-containing protein [Chitinophagaceae bacterium]